MSLHAYRSLLNDFYAELRIFRTWRNIWKASVLTAVDLVIDTDDHAEKRAIEAWERVEAIHRDLTSLHTALGIPCRLPELPVEEITEDVQPLRGRDA